MTTAAESKTFDTGEVVLAYSEWPGESPPVVTLHGISGTRNADLASARGGRRAFAYDHRGHGDSGRTPGAYTFVNFGRDCVAFLRLVVKEPALLVGHSLGGMTAIYAAADAPELVRAAFLIDPPLYAPQGPLRDERQPFAAMIDMAGKPVAELVAGGMPPEWAARVTKLDPGVMSMIVDQSGFAGWDTDAFLSRIECPVVLEHGDRDQGSVIYPGELERATSLIRGCTVLHLAGTGHAPWMNDRDCFFAELSRFVESA
jgi:pimeloyl-ACP methyl ester carboxylesterase